MKEIIEAKEIREIKRNIRNKNKIKRTINK